MAKRFGAGLDLGIVGTVLGAIAGWLTVGYNVAASDQHAEAVRWTLHTTMQRSVPRRAGDGTLPESFPEDLIVAGAEHHAASCVYCHGAPGDDPTGWSRGMRPEPPHLAEAASEWTAEEIHWIVENGIRMSGMPAFAGHRSADELLALTAFVTALPGLSADDYAALTGRSAAD